MNPHIKKCACRGQGFYLSEMDGSWIRCDFHGEGVDSPYSPNQGEITASLKAILVVQKMSGWTFEDFFNEVYSYGEESLSIDMILERAVDLANQIQVEDMEKDEDEYWGRANESEYFYGEDYGC